MGDEIKELFVPSSHKITSEDHSFILPNKAQVFKVRSIRSAGLEKANPSDLQFLLINRRNAIQMAVCLTNWLSLLTGIP